MGEFRAARLAGALFELVQLELCKLSWAGNREAIFSWVGSASSERHWTDLLRPWQVNQVRMVNQQEIYVQGCFRNSIKSKITFSHRGKDPKEFPIDRQTQNSSIGCPIALWIDLRGIALSSDWLSALWDNATLKPRPPRSHAFWVKTFLNWSFSRFGVGQKVGMGEALIVPTGVSDALAHSRYLKWPIYKDYMMSNHTFICCRNQCSCTLLIFINLFCHRIIEACKKYAKSA